MDSKDDLLLTSFEPEEVSNFLRRYDALVASGKRMPSQDDISNEPAVKTLKEYMRRGLLLALWSAEHSEKDVDSISEEDIRTYLEEQVSKRYRNNLGELLYNKVTDIGPTHSCVQRLNNIWIQVLEL